MHGLVSATIPARLPAIVLAIALVVLSAGCGENPATTNTEPDPTNVRPFSLGRIGALTDTLTTPTPLIFLGGGGTDNDDGMRLLVEAANRGNITIVRTSGGNAYNAYLYELAPVASVETFLLSDARRADNVQTNAVIAGSEVVFIAGGDQWQYTLAWNNTRLDDTLRTLIRDRNIAIGGTSAGAMVLGGRFFDASRGSITSDEALSDPFREAVSLRSGLFGSHPLLADRIIDTHFTQRGRQGRLMTFLARTRADQPGISGIGIDERTAFVIDADGIGTAYGPGQVWLYLPGVEGPENLRTGQPLTWFRGREAVRVWKLSNGERFDMHQNLPLDRPAGYFAFVQNGQFTIEADGE